MLRVATLRKLSLPTLFIAFALLAAPRPAQALPLQDEPVGAAVARFTDWFAEYFYGLSGDPNGGPSGASAPPVPGGPIDSPFATGDASAGCDSGN